MTGNYIMGIEKLTITTPDDFHVHLRDGPMLRAVLPFSAAIFRRNLIMPNRPWIARAAHLMLYRDELLRAAEAAGYPDFVPLMTIALEDSTTPAMIEAAHAAGAVSAKLYPIARTEAGITGATTGPSAGGPRGVAEPLAPGMHEVYRAMAACGMVLCVHAERPKPFPRLRRETGYLHIVEDIVVDHSNMKVVLEHISTEDAADLICAGYPNMAATITAHHLIDTIDDSLESPHHLCNPVPKNACDRESLWNLIHYCHPRVFFGSDSAPHPVSAKHCARPVCGCFSAPGLLPRLAGMFEERGLLDRLEGFVSHHGADWYGLPRNEGTVTLVKRPSGVPAYIGTREADLDGFVVVWRGGETLAWSNEESSR